MKLIDKSALVAEIEKAIKIIYAGREYVGIPYGEECIVSGLQKAEDIINTLEVKEVDLEKEYKDFISSDNGRSMFETAEHFFALGMAVSNKAQKK